MTTTDLTALRPAGTLEQRSARVAGLLYLITFLTSIPTLSLYAPLRDHADFVLGAGSSSSVLAGALLETVLAVACVGTAVALFPSVSRHSPTGALGFLAARVVEAALILVGVTSVLSLVALRADPAGYDAPALVAVSHALVTVYDKAFLLGQSLMPVISAVCLGSALFRSRLVPRLIPAIGLVGAPLLLASDIAILLQVYGRNDWPAGLAALPVAAWELALGVRLVVKGLDLPLARTRPVTEDGAESRR